MYLLDTNILSALVKKVPNSNLVDRLREVPGEALFTSSITVMELRYGAARVGARSQQLWGRIVAELLSRVQVLGFGGDEAVQAGEILAKLEKQGQVISVEDIMIAAVALAHDLVLVTDNVRHLGRIQGLRVENWLIES